MSHDHLTRRYRRVRLPECFTLLLLKTLRGTSDDQISLTSLVGNRSDLQMLFEKYFYDDQRIKTPTNILQTIGRDGIKNRLAAVFLFYEKHKCFPNDLNREMNTAHIVFLKKVEDLFTPLTAGGHSRAFLFAFFLAMNYCKDNNGAKDLEIIFQDLERVASVLRQYNVRTVQIDWMVLLYNHLECFLDKDKFLNILNKKIPFNEIIDMLDSSKTTLLIKNLLSYGYSINESQIFFEHIV